MTYEDFATLFRQSPDAVGFGHIREEVYSAERLERHALELAKELKVGGGTRGRSLAPELKRSQKELLEAYRALTDVVRSKQSVSPAAEWFIDNFHIVEDQLRDIRRHMPPNYYRGLPKLAEGPLQGQPRVYALAVSMLAHTDGRLDVDALRRFVRSFQSVTPLSIGELWAVAISLRLALVEFLKPLAVRIVKSRHNRTKADELADRILKMSTDASTTKGMLAAALATELGNPKDFDRAYIVQLIQRLRDQDSDVWPAFEWIETQLKTQGTDTSQMIHLEHHRQAAAQVTVGNIISSMRLLSALDWKEFFESVSLVDRVLSEDPVYLKMEFSTRDNYRYVIERLARRSKFSETEVAKQAIGLSKESGLHVGHFFEGTGLVELEDRIGFRLKLRERVIRFVKAHPTMSYLWTAALLTTAVLWPIIDGLWAAKLSSTIAVLFSLFLFVPISEVALSVLNYLITRLVRPQSLPKIETARGIPAEGRCMVVVPTLLSSRHGVDTLIEALQIRCIANDDPELYYALLGDFSDADGEHLDTDAAILRQAQDAIAELNRLYPNESGDDRFHLFLRKRLWNSSEKKWMGWERKRGKIEEFNKLLRSQGETSFDVVTASRQLMNSIRYVITLDSDTRLPRDSARRLIGAMLHPSNKRYAVLQPRISVAHPGALRTRFAHIFAGYIGIDPYTTSVSDVYQDFFGEGSFTGKGIYDVDAFQAALEGRVPANTILSHDLFEGGYAHCGLVTDVELFDDFPTNFGIYIRRLHRWTRGDWQIMRWVFPRVPNSEGVSVANELNSVSRWKILDNLRRSLATPSLVLALVLAWFALPGDPWKWTLFVLALPVIPLMIPIVVDLLVPRKEISWSGHFRSSRTSFGNAAVQFFCMLALLPEFAWAQTDAIVRTLYRIFVSRRKLLEWMSFAQDQGRSSREISLWEKVGPGPLVALLSVVGAAMLRPQALLPVAPLAVLWAFAPLLRAWLAKPIPTKIKALKRAEAELYRNYARRTWRFFETFVTEQDNWLAPDNFQENPNPVVARRTSPTNIGLQLLAACSAHDLGYMALVDMIESLERTFGTLAKLERVHGHFYNWYDTQNLKGLNPRYVSTVDSGNLAGHLIALKQSCLDKIENPYAWPRIQNGLWDTLKVLGQEIERELYERHGTSSPEISVVRKSVSECLTRVGAEVCETKLQRLEFLNTVSSELNLIDDSLEALSVEDNGIEVVESRSWSQAAKLQVEGARRDVEMIDADEGTLCLSDELRGRLAKLAENSERMLHEMDFAFLFDSERKIFVIGYNVFDERRDNSFYDLLASESRLASIVAIATGDVPQEHWFRLGRQLTQSGSGRALVSWSATMFEYLMPLLVTRGYPGTLLDETYRSVLSRQIEYARHHRVPWGISEAGYNARDLELNYQYGPFGVPGLGLKRGLSDELVVSPYSTMLAGMVDPHLAIENLKILESMGVLGRYGFYESIDYTPERLPQKQSHVILQSFMAHHQGMSFVAINNILNGSVMQRRFHADPLVQSTELLLQERVPHAVNLAQPRAEEAKLEGVSNFSSNLSPRTYTSVHLPHTETQILSNGEYSVLVSTSGGGYSRSGRIAVNRWREDSTRDNWGQFIYIRNLETDKFWSVGNQAIGSKPDRYEVAFTEDKVDIYRRDGVVLTHTEIIVAPEDNVELRRVSISNMGKDTMELEVTSFFEVALAPHSDDLAHPAFSNLFVQTDYMPAWNALLASRRRRSPSEAEIWGFHVLAVEGTTSGNVQYETDRVRFLGRGRTSSDASAIVERRPLSNTIGSVLDPIFSLRRKLVIRPGETVRACFSTGVAGSRAEAERLAECYHDAPMFAREAELAWTEAHVQLRHLNISPDQAHVYQQLAARIVYSSPSLRPSSRVIAQNRKAQSDLWAYGIGGDLPVVLTSISEEKDMSMIRELLHAHEYLRMKGLVFDLVIINERPASYLQGLQDEIQRQIRIGGSKALIDKPGGIFVRRSDLLSAEDLVLLKTVARVNLQASKGGLEAQLKREALEKIMPDALVPTLNPKSYNDDALILPDFQFFNGLGGFGQQGREYIILLKEGQWTPAPWINVIANENDFGFIVSESGSGYTWSINSRENRLSPWSNDAVSDPPGEAIYIRDEETGEFWSPTPLPIRSSGTYLIRHGQGFSTFEHSSHGLSHRLDLFVPREDSVKISRLRIKNKGSTARTLSVTSYVEWVLGFTKSASAPYVVTECDSGTGAILARNTYNNEFSTRVAFADISAVDRSYTCDRREFIGSGGRLAAPVALLRQDLSNSSGAKLDPCAAFQTKFTLAPGEEKEFIVQLGQSASAEGALSLVQKYRDTETVASSLNQVREFWAQTFDSIRVRTPDDAMNVMMNSWLLYQTLSCRIWARSAFYQSGGAYGFRDQLQDVMAMVYSKPDVARAQILRASARQFKEGDVQHWWHPPTGRGVRTRFSDDLLWLPYVTSFYVAKTGDYSVLDEVVPFIEAPELEEGKDDAYILPSVSKESGSLREHCARALDRSLKVGRNGLPLMGSGDWNDGMSLVGNKGEGESVWVAWFLYATMRDFIPFLEASGESDRIGVYRKHLDSMKVSIEKNAWDGDWYRRAYFDDGTPLGSSSNEECRIDSIVQSWSVLSGAGNPERQARAMSAVDEYLINRGEGLVKLFTPPFDKGDLNPGYIKGYVPGVRENGGQYTHAAIWTLMAFAELGDGDKAGELYALLNPVNHALTRAGVHKYKVEPYVTVADIYGLSPHVGRGGWTWYTGSASWMYRAGLESILGFDLRGDTLVMKPRVPSLWRTFEIVYRHKSSTYRITATRSFEATGASPSGVLLDGQPLGSQEIPLVDDGAEHSIEISL